MPYYILTGTEFESNEIVMHFGDYDRSVVIEEMDDMKDNCLSTAESRSYTVHKLDSDTQETINQFVLTLNA